MTTTSHISRWPYHRPTPVWLFVALQQFDGLAGYSTGHLQPTGVEVGHAMVHGGPFPGTSDSRTTSVGSLAIRRFLRPVCYQDLDADLLPQELQDENLLSLLRLKDGLRTLN